MKSIYPKIDIKESTIQRELGQLYHCIYLETFLRLKHDDGKYYLVCFKKTQEVHENSAKSEKERNTWKNQFINRVLNEIHLIQHCYIIDGNITTTEGNSICELDLDQQPEKERIKNLNKY